ncbi:MAG: YaaA family protein [Muribaculaceae bacterium]|nr:YaaA family protein [Muribaculaceae bacterium]
MIILIAESKTMVSSETVITPEDFSRNKPIYEEKADEIMGYLGRLPIAELVEATGLSSSLASKMQRYIYEFPNKGLGLKAIEAFTGVVFKALDFTTLSDVAKLHCEEKVRIISSLYGWLRPSDIVKPYRLDFKSKASPTHVALNAFWKQNVTIALVKMLKVLGENTVLNLLPSDAAKCIDWKLVKNFCNVWKVDFVEITQNGTMKAPTASKLKTMRGTLLRQILTDDINDIASLKTAATDHYMCEGTPVYPDRLQFIC